MKNPKFNSIENQSERKQYIQGKILWQSEKAGAARLVCLSSSPSEKAQRGEQGWSDMVENRKGDMGLETKDM